MTALWPTTKAVHKYVTRMSRLWIPVSHLRDRAQRPLNNEMHGSCERRKVRGLVAADLQVNLERLGYSYLPMTGVLCG